MTTSTLARTAFAAAATGAMLLGSVTMAGAASADETAPEVRTLTISVADAAVLKAPFVTKPLGRRLG
jgi:hypothetical protein